MKKFDRNAKLPALRFTGSIMNTNDRIRLIVDTNVWISSLIGRSLIGINQIFNHPFIELITTPHLIEEIEIVTSRPKFSNYFGNESVRNLINWMRENMTSVEIGDVPSRCRDPKDDYLLELAIQSHAIYLVSGDQDLLSLGHIEGCTIMTVAQFEEEWVKFTKEFGNVI